MTGFLLVILLAAVTDVPAPDGAQLYATFCAACHGAQQWGSPDGPSLRGVGLAAVDFFLTTGRMPAAVPWIEVGQRDERSGQQLPLEAIRAIEGYLAPVAGGPAIPWVVADGNRRHGRDLYELNCQHCHGATGEGGALGEFTWAPSLHRASINQVADAIRAGPGEMPRFGDQQLTQDDLNDVASYVMDLQVPSQPVAVPPFRSSGPVPEGAVAYIAIIVLVAFLFTFGRRSGGNSA